MTYDGALEFIHGTEKFGAVLGLQKISKLLEILGNPQDKLKFIHVAGTKGKGSTCVMLSDILTEQGYNTGLYISPYVEDFCERIQCNGAKIPHESVSALTLLVKDACEKMASRGFPHPTEFEIVTAVGFLYFAQKKCDYVVLEVGLGGRFDATNVIPSPLLAVITLIGIDHTRELGDTVEKIAYEKCGIIKEGSAVVSYPQENAKALSVIKKQAAEKNTPLYLTNMDNVKILENSVTPRFIYNGLEISLGLMGIHQIKNAATVLNCVFTLRGLGVKISDAAILSGLKNTRFAGRMEFIRDNLLIDAAHNEVSIRAFCEAVKAIVPDRRLIIVTGIFADKDYMQCAEILKGTADTLIATEPSSARALPAADYARILNTDHIYPSPEQAVSFALSIVEKGGLICVCGSLHLIAEVREIFFDGRERS